MRGEIRIYSSVDPLKKKIFLKCEYVGSVSLNLPTYFVKVLERVLADL